MLTSDNDNGGRREALDTPFVGHGAPVGHSQRWQLGASCQQMSGQSSLHGNWQLATGNCRRCTPPALRLVQCVWGNWSLVWFSRSCLSKLSGPSSGHTPQTQKASPSLLPPPASSSSRLSHQTANFDLGCLEIWSGLLPRPRRKASHSFSRPRIPETS